VVNVELADAEISRRLAGWRPPDLSNRVRPGSVRDKYIRLVSSAHEGCVL
jgi:dihydroxy-acid dehydratase